MSVVDEAVASLTDARDRFGPSVAVGFSGGKDSLVCLDLATRIFDHVVAYHMWFISGLACVEAELDKARRRWGVQILSYPHWDLAAALRGGVYCVEGEWTEDLPRWEMSDIYSMVMSETGAGCVVRGSKLSDSVWRRRTMATIKRETLIHPLAQWNKRDVLAYLHAQQIPVPSSTGSNATGIDLKRESVLWLHDNHPDDYRRMLEVFPFAEAIVWRREFYG